MVVFNKNPRKNLKQIEKYESDIMGMWTNVQLGSSIQEIFTPFSLVLEMLEKVHTLDNRDVCVIANSEIYLFIKGLKEKGVKNFQYKSLTFITDIKSLEGKDNIKVVDFNNISDLNIDMKFDVVIGNPPYQLEVGTSTYSKPIQNDFVEFAIRHGDKITLLTQANYCGPINSTIKKLLSGNNTTYFSYTNAFKKTVPSIEVSWFLIENDIGESPTILKNKFNEEFEHIIKNGKPIPLLEPKANLDILTKISSSSYLDQNFNINYEVLNSKIEFCKDGKNYVVQTVGNANEAVKYYQTNTDLNHNADLFSKWKCVTPWVGGKGVIGNIKVVKPETIISKSVVGLTFDSEIEANNCKKYLDLKLVKFLVKTVKVATNNSKALFSNIPKLDFVREYTDMDLYKLFNLTQEEIDLVEATVK